MNTEQQKHKVLMLTEKKLSALDHNLVLSTNIQSNLLNQQQQLFSFIYLKNKQNTKRRLHFGPYEEVALCRPDV